jgi:FKBP-type peptidyl-prolyl cis-trans isomerase 2
LIKKNSFFTFITNIQKMSKIKNGDTVTVNYVGKLEDGTIFDSSLNEGREPLVCTLGQKQLIPGFENGLIDMSVGEKKTIEILPEDGYGPYRSEMVFDIPKGQFPDGVKEGDVLNAQSAMGPVNVTVMGVAEETIKIDANHPLAGKKLIFELDVVNVS